MQNTHLELQISQKKGQVCHIH